MESLTKQRDIVFSPHLDNGVRLDNVDLASKIEIGDDQAKSAIFLLADVDGVLDLKYLSHTNILITYDVRSLSLDMILSALSSVGFSLDDSLLSKIKNALCVYSEETLRENLGITGSKQTRNIFMEGYQRRSHGCRDQRSIHWRRYL